MLINLLIAFCADSNKESESNDKIDSLSKKDNQIETNTPQNSEPVDMSRIFNDSDPSTLPKTIIIPQLQSQAEDHHEQTTHEIPPSSEPSHISYNSGQENLNYSRMGNNYLVQPTQPHPQAIPQGSVPIASVSAWNGQQIPSNDHTQEVFVPQFTQTPYLAQNTAPPVCPSFPAYQQSFPHPQSCFCSQQHSLQHFPHNIPVYRFCNPQPAPYSIYPTQNAGRLQYVGTLYLSQNTTPITPPQVNSQVPNTAQFVPLNSVSQTPYQSNYYPNYQPITHQYNHNVAITENIACSATSTIDFLSQRFQQTFGPHKAQKSNCKQFTIPNSQSGIANCGKNTNLCLDFFKVMFVSLFSIKDFKNFIHSKKGRIKEYNKLIKFENSVRNRDNRIDAELLRFISGFYAKPDSFDVKKMYPQTFYLVKQFLHEIYFFHDQLWRSAATDECPFRIVIFTEKLIDRSNIRGEKAYHAKTKYVLSDSVNSNSKTILPENCYIEIKDHMKLLPVHVAPDLFRRGFYKCSKTIIYQCMEIEGYIHTKRIIFSEENILNGI